ncbi:hypothetical protein ACH347_36225 [Saccharopolyspora sp. 5N102]|uniref:hypothetical protein n=1 Tax=Saccharopolyspora sp. 5N102 TaxID=3375155 RepID=UPI0037B8E322
MAEPTRGHARGRYRGGGRVLGGEVHLLQERGYSFGVARAERTHYPVDQILVGDLLRLTVRRCEDDRSPAQRGQQVVVLAVQALLGGAGLAELALGVGRAFPQQGVQRSLGTEVRGEPVDVGLVALPWQSAGGHLLRLHHAVEHHGPHALREEVGIHLTQVCPVGGADVGQLL